MKSIKVKIAKHDVNKIQSCINWYGNVAKQLEQKILILSGKKFYDKDGSLVIDGETELNKLCNGNTNLIVACKEIYDGFVTVTGKKMGLTQRSYVSAFMGGRDTGDTSKKGRKPTKEKSKEKKDYFNKFKNNLTLLESSKIFPFQFNNFNYTNGQYKYALVKEIYTKLSSYELEDISTKKEYSDLENNIKIINEKIEKKYNKTILNDFKNFVAECDLLNHRINNKFIQYLRDNMFPYPQTAFWVDRSGNKHKYSIKSTVIGLLNKYKSLVTGNDPILLFKDKDSDDNDKIGIDIEEYCDLIFKFKIKKNYASYTPITTNTCKFLLGKNLIKFKVNKVNDELIWSFNDQDKKKIEFITHYIRKGKGKHYQLENLEITPDGDNYKISYSCNGKQPFNGNFKEPNIISRKNGLFVQLPVNINIDKDKLRIRNSLRGQFNKSYPSIDINNKQKRIFNLKDQTKSDIDESLKKLGKPLTVMGVDLNLRGIATSVFTYDGIKELPISTNYVSGDLVEQRKISVFTKKVKNTLSLIKLANLIYKLDAEQTNEFISNNKNKDIGEYLNWLKKMKESNVKLYELKYVNCDWIVSILFQEIKKEFGQFKIDRRFNGYNYLNSLYWADAIKQFINLSKSYTNVGREAPKKKNGLDELKNPSDFCIKKQKLCNNIKEDYAKKVASYIVGEAVKNNVDIIAVEELKSNMGSKDYKTKNDNEMQLKWNCGRIKTHIEHMAGDYGILLTEVNEFETSQIHYETGNYGYRDEDNCEILWYKDKNNNLQQCHADKNAASNIAMRFLSRHTNIYSYPIKKVNKDVNDTKYILNINKESTRLNGAAYKEFNDTKKTFDFTIPSGTKKLRICKINGQWVDNISKNNYVSSIKAMIPKN